MLRLWPLFFYADTGQEPNYWISWGRFPTINMIGSGEDFTEMSLEEGLSRSTTVSCWIVQSTEFIVETSAIVALSGLYLAFHYNVGNWSFHIRAD
ncbi:MAG: hypothetical protein ACLFUS_06800 [Candidatus Sumerlaeia bacterium]